MNSSFVKKIIFIGTFLMMFCCPLSADAEIEESAPLLWEQGYSFRIGGGYSASLLDLDFAVGTLLGEDAIVQDDDVEQNGSVAFTLAFKHHISRAPQYISIGLSLDVYHLPVEEFDFLAVSANNILVINDFDIADIFVVSMVPFIEFRLPIHVIDEIFIAPYIQGGIGVSFNIAEENDAIEDVDVDTASISAVLGGGVEVSVNEKVSLFFETRWHYNKAELTFEPLDDTEFEADADLSNVSFTVGVNLYFGA